MEIHKSILYGTQNLKQLYSLLILLDCNLSDISIPKINLAEQALKLVQNIAHRIDPMRY